MEVLYGFMGKHGNIWGYPLVNVYSLQTWSHGHRKFVGLGIKNCDVPSFFVRLPEGISWIWIWFMIAAIADFWELGWCWFHSDNFWFVVDFLRIRGPHLCTGLGVIKNGWHWYPLVNIQKTIENGHRNSGFSHSKWWFSIAMLVYQRVTAVETAALQTCLYNYCNWGINPPAVKHRWLGDPWTKRAVHDGFPSKPCWIARGYTTQ